VTRLREEDLWPIAKELAAYDADLERKTGLGLKRIASRAAEIPEEAFSSRPAAAIPMTSGCGRIAGFTETVAAILSYLGVPAILPSATDVMGITEAISKGAEIIFLADDHRFAAIDLPRRKVVENSGATARGYVTALEALTGGLKNQKVLVIGAAGEVGRQAVKALAGRGAGISAYDPNQEGLSSLRFEVGLEIWSNLEEALQQHRIYFDASPAPGVIHARHIQPETMIAAPGIPLGVSTEAARMVGDRILHDPLQIGVATMLAEALA
jgi:3-methylornithyl-N6-L-lysine dehydrogenase